MRTLPPPSLFVITVAVAVALSSAACGPSIDPAAKADIDRRVSVLQAGSNAVPAPAPGMFAPMPFAVGQWTQYKMTNDKNEPSFLTYKVIGQDGDAVWLEIVNESYHGRDDAEDAGRVRQPHGPEPGPDPRGQHQGCEGHRQRDAAAGDLDDAVDATAGSSR